MHQSRGVTRSPNQPIPTRGRKRVCVVITKIYHRNQPIPTRGRKHSAHSRRSFFMGTNPSPSGDENAIKIFYRFGLFPTEPTHPHSGTKISISSACLYLALRNQPIPKRGRKFSEFGNTSKLELEPTHPQAGTKISKPYHIQTYAYEPTHPQAGTKILHL